MFSYLDECQAYLQLYVYENCLHKNPQWIKFVYVYTKYLFALNQLKLKANWT